MKMPVRAYLSDAACRSPHVDPSWFHSKHMSDIRNAIAVCDTCPVTAECGLDRERDNAPGVWAGQRWIPARNQRVRLDARFHSETGDTSPFAKKVATRRKLVAGLFRDGVAVTEIARRLGVNPKTVVADIRTLP